MLALLGGTGCRDASRMDAASPEQFETVLLEQAPSSAVVRQVAYRRIDLYASLLKHEVDIGLAMWDSLTPEQRRHLLYHLITALSAARTQVLAGSRLTPSLPISPPDAEQSLK